MAKTIFAPAVGRKFHDFHALASEPVKGIKILKCKLIRGCNIYHRASVMRLDVELSWLAGSSTRGAGPDFAAQFKERFLRSEGLIPPCETSTDFLKRLDSADGVPVEEALLQAILAVEREILARMRYLGPIDFAAVSSDPAGRPVVLIWETRNPEMSRASAGLAVQGITELLLRAAGLPTDDNFAAGIQALKKRARRQRLSGSAALLKLAARRRGLYAQSGVASNHLMLGQGMRQRHLFSSLPGSSAFGATKLAVDKRTCNRRLKEVSLPVPLQISVADAGEAFAALEQIGFPAVIKPVRGNEGRGVTAGLRTPQEVGPAFDYAAAREAGVLVEQWIPGTEYRLLVVGGRFIAALTCVPPVVTGDGKHTIRELVEKLNAEPDRDNLRLYPVIVDAEMSRHLSHQGCSVDEISSEGRTLGLRSWGHVDTGGTPIDVTDSVHRDNRSIAEKAALAIGLDVAGVDLITTDITRSYREVGCSILKVKARPALCMHVWPRKGRSRDVAGPIVDLLFPQGDDGIVPAVLVAGDRGTGRIARATGELLQERGFTVGLSLKRAAYLGGLPLDISSPKLAEAPQILLRDPSLECLVAAVSLRRSATQGLNLEACDAAALLPRKHERDAHGFDEGIEVLIKANRGRFVISTDNTAARSALAGIDPGRVILLSAQPDDADAQSQIAAGRCAAVKTWDGGRPCLTVFENGRPAASAHLQEGARARPKDIETQLFAFVLAYAAGLYRPKEQVASDPRDEGKPEGSVHLDDGI